jgi:hypothetical protein
VTLPGGILSLPLAGKVGWSMSSDSNFNDAELSNVRPITKGIEKTSVFVIVTV